MVTVRNIVFSLIVLALIVACRPGITPEKTTNDEKQVQPMPSLTVVSATPQPTVVPTPTIPNLQTELLDDLNKTTTSKIGEFDFKNYTYELPRGWQNPDGSTDVTLTNGKLAAIETSVGETADEDAKAEAKAQRRIGISFVAAKFFDVTGDGDDEALVVLKIETGGGAVPQIVYIFTWKNGKPELIWPFRTGDRADGGLKTLRAENGLLLVELYGQDRFLLGQTETGKIGDDYEQLCCPTYFTRTFYKWNGKNFLMQGKRLTYLTAAPSETPVENMGEVVEKKGAKK